MKAKKFFSAKRDSLFWLLIVALTFGVALRWPLWARIFVTALAVMQLGQVAVCVVQALRKEA